MRHDISQIASLIYQLIFLYALYQFEQKSAEMKLAY